MKVKAIIFDLDNTLIDFMKMKKEACKAAVKAMIRKGLKLSFKKAYKKLMKTYFRVGIESDKAFEKFLEEQGLKDERILAVGIQAYLEKKRKFLKPYPKVKQTLKKLKELGIKLAIVTDAPKLKAYQRIVSLGIDDFFDFVIGKEDTGMEKAGLEPLRLAIQKLSFKPKEIVLVGDSIERDIKPAKKLGIKTVLAKYGQEKKERGKADFEIKRVEDLLKFIG